MSKKLTIGMATYDDYDGVYFSIQAIRMYHPEILKDIEFIIVDNNPGGAHSTAIANLVNHIKDRIPTQHILYDKKQSTAVRNEVFNNSNTPYTLCMDSHILFPGPSLNKLIEYFENNKGSGDLLHGPMLYDCLDYVVTHMDPVWRDQMYGIWASDPKGFDINGEPFEIPMHGMGVFACETDSWLGFSDKFKGFGGEEGYIHRKYENAGRRTLCLPFLRWMHRFDRPNGTKYVLDIKDRIRNYYFGWTEVGLDVSEIREHFLSNNIQEEVIDQAYNEFKMSDNIEIIDILHEERKKTRVTSERTDNTLCYGKPVNEKRIGTVDIDGKQYPVYGTNCDEDSIKIYPHDHSIGLT
jgi:hypothetical protein